MKSVTTVEVDRSDCEFDASACMGAMKAVLDEMCRKLPNFTLMKIESKNQRSYGVWALVVRIEWNI